MPTTIYSTPTCPYCIMAKNFFKKHNVSYAEKDVSSDQEAAQEMIKKILSHYAIRASGGGIDGEGHKCSKLFYY